MLVDKLSDDSLDFWVGERKEIGHDYVNISVNKWPEKGRLRLGRLDYKVYFRYIDLDIAWNIYLRRPFYIWFKQIFIKLETICISFIIQTNWKGQKA